MNSAEAASCEKGYQTMICNAYYEKNYEQCYLEMLKQQRVDGIIFGTHTTLDISQYANIRRPIVALDRNLGGDIPCVLADHETGGKLAAEELIRSGCRNVVQPGGIRYEDKVTTLSNVRYEVFAETMREHGISCRSYDAKWQLSDGDYYHKVADELMESCPEVDGVFATDLMIMAILQSALAHGRKVPDDLKLVAYDGTYGIGFVYPRITAVMQPIDGLAAKAVELVIDLINEKPIKEKKIRLPVALCPGQTTMRG